MAPNLDREIETRLLIVAEMLDKAVTEVRRVMGEIRGEDIPKPSDEARSETDG